jgi:hypothetical protein
MKTEIRTQVIKDDGTRIDMTTRSDNQAARSNVSLHLSDESEINISNFPPSEEIAAFSSVSIGTRGGLHLYLKDTASAQRLADAAQSAAEHLAAAVQEECE